MQQSSPLGLPVFLKLWVVFILSISYIQLEVKYQITHFNIFYVIKMKVVLGYKLENMSIV